MFLLRVFWVAIKLKESYDDSALGGNIKLEKGYIKVDFEKIF